MTLWARTRHLPLLGAVLLVALCIGWFGDTREIVMPVFFGSVGGRTALFSFTPLLWGVAVADVFAPTRLSVEVRPARRLGLVDTGLLLVTGAVSGAIFSLFANVAGPTLFGLGSMLIATGLVAGLTVLYGPGPGAFAISALVLVTGMYAVDAPAAKFVRVLQPEAPLWWSIGCGVLLLAWASWLLITNRVRTLFRVTEGIG